MNQRENKKNEDKNRRHVPREAGAHGRKNESGGRTTGHRGRDEEKKIAVPGRQGPRDERLRQFAHGGRGQERLSAVSGRNNKTIPSVPYSSVQINQLSKDVKEFWGMLIKRYESKDKGTYCFQIHDKHDLELWNKCWSAAASGAGENIPILIKILLKLPNIDHVVPPPLIVVKVLIIVAKKTSKPDELIDIANIVRDRLKDRISDTQSELIDNAKILLNSFRDSFRRILLECDSNQTSELAKRLKNFEDYNKCLESSSKSEKEEENATMHVQDWLGWRDNPTVGWLTSESWLQKLPLLPSYESSDQYSERLLRLWTQLTFYWGAGSLWPRCLHGASQSNDKSCCGEPMLLNCLSSEFVCCQRKSNSSNCNNNASWRCYRKGHHAICSTCLNRQKSFLSGLPSKQASTDVYDGVVERETVRREGHIFLVSDLESRKPPAIAPNWKTSYRLKVSGLVAVVRLGNSGQALSPNFPIQWAEIVPYNNLNNKDGDWICRTRGKLALRLIGRGDCPSIHSNADTPLNLHGRIAIIDLRVFVPEVVSVLSIFARDNFQQTLSEIPFINHLIGLQVSEPLNTTQLNFEIFSHERMIREAIHRSDIEVLQSVTADIRNEVSNKILELDQVRNLYGTQLEAFVMGLSKAVHCTQGPPGTGKSFVGVALVLAFVVIKDTVKCHGRSLGPVLMLSYKNHALDEFLVDVIKFSNAKLNRSDLIRVGKSENTVLQNFCEKSSPNEKEAEEELLRRIKLVRNLHQVEKDWRKCSDVLLTLALSSDDDDVTKHADFRSYVEKVANCLALYQWYIANKEKDNHASEIANFLGQESNMKSKVPPCDLVNEFKGLEHWRPKTDLTGWSQFIFLLNNWLLGQSPPPRCVFHNQDGVCMFPCSNESNYCHNLHRCKYEENSKRHCRFERKLNSDFCNDHSCLHTNSEGINCKSFRFSEFKYCLSHTCPKCSPSEAKMLNGSESCLDHQCKAVTRGKTCEKISFHLFQFCEKHLCLACIDLGLEKASPVADFDKGSFCDDHECAYEKCHRLVYWFSDNRTNKYCINHSCILCVNSGDEISAVDKFGESRFCQKHRCSHNDNCNHPKIDISDFCVLHTCRICRKQGNYAKDLITDNFPRNTCANHILCSFIFDTGDTCNLCCFDGEFCTLHKDATEDSKILLDHCSGTTKKGKKCGTRRPMNVNGKWYCNDHINQKTIEADDKMADDSLNVDSIESLKSIEYPQPKEFIPDHVPSIRCCWKFPCPSRIPARLATEVTWLCPLHVCASDLITTESQDDLEVLNPKDDTLHDTMRSPNNESKENLLNGARVLVDQQRISQSDQLSINDDENEWEQYEYITQDHIVGDNPDEMQYEAFEESDEEENTELMRLGEIDNIDDGENDKISDRVSEQSDYNQNVFEDDEISFDDLLHRWVWDSSRDDRLKIASQFVRKFCELFKGIRLKCEPFVLKARVQKAEAGADVFKKANIVGSTVVGASRRLEAIRAAEPFAVVVEEACEVMEPTLMAVLAVKSLRKLELIGDHRQLPAFVQNCWYNIEMTNPSIKVSLFERLIDDPKHAKKYRLPSISRSFTILDEQRRMRPNIADITRPEYNDVVKILDHDQTKRQRVGDKIISKEERDNLNSHLEVIDPSVQVPGMYHNIFFWNIDGNVEGRPVKGLSACNQVESEAVAQLVKWLTECGSPKSSITVITPYKGQKSAIISSLRKANLLPSRNNDDDLPFLTVSTVDRYQGDENDIIILSLVKTKPGNRFVALLNRWIVAVSRARIGLYIIGSVNAVTSDGDGPRHWKRFIDDLKGGYDDDDKMSRVSPSLTACCPRHRNICAKIKNPNQFPKINEWSKFCMEQCPYKLKQCGHACKIKCHSPTATSHTQVCKENVKRPCEKHHEVPLECAKALGGYKKLDQGLHNFKCDIKVLHKRKSCDHVIELDCYLQKQWESIDVTECSVIVGNYFKKCGHYIENVECSVFRNYQINPPTCKIKVPYINSICKCEVPMECFNAIKERMNPSTCLQVKNIKRPRCNHMLSVKCIDGQTLQNKWNSDPLNLPAEWNGDSVVVKYGEKYGRDEKYYLSSIDNCFSLVDYQRSCGHLERNIMCSLAFSYALLSHPETKCVESVLILCPICKQKASVSCSTASVLKFQNTSIETANDNNSAVLIIREQNIPTRLSRILLDVAGELKKSCANNVKIIRSCSDSHVMTTRCSTFIDIISGSSRLPKCKEMVFRTLPCGHQISVLCCEKFSEPPPKCNEKVNRVYEYSCGEHTELVDKCWKYEELSNTNPSCCSLVEYQRFRCNHSSRIKCCQRDQVMLYRGNKAELDENSRTIVRANILYCRPGPFESECTVNVSYIKTCGHTLKDIPCADAFRMSSGEMKTPSCYDITLIQSPLCEHDIEIPCFEVETITSWKAWDGEVPELEEVEDPFDSQICKVIRTTSKKPNRVVNFKQSLLKCNSEVVFVRDCDHFIKRCCADAYYEQPEICREENSFTCDYCEFTSKILCYKYVENIRKGLPMECRNYIEGTCSKCYINKVKLQCFKRESARCKKSVTATQSCGHDVTWDCESEENPLLSNDYECRLCGIQLWESALLTNPPFDEVGLSVFQDMLRQYLDDCVLNQCEVTERCDYTMVENKFERYVNSRLEYIKNMLKFLRNGGNRNHNSPRPPPHWTSKEDVVNYHIVCYQLKPDDLKKDLKDIAKNAFIDKSTNYGQAVVLDRVSKIDDLNKYTSEESVKLLFGVAYCHKCLYEAPEFVASSKDNKIANKKRLEKISMGYDCAQQGNTTKYAYWSRSSVIPISQVTIKINAKCIVCFDYFPYVEGHFCSKKHFICLKCLGNYVSQASKPDSMAQYVDKKGDLLCSECMEPYNLNSVCLKSPQIFEDLLKLKMNVSEKHAVNEAVDNERKRRQEEFDNLLKLDEEEREIEMIRKDIVENILTLRCPNPSCRAAFIDFDGCFALTCNSCRTGFCAWCLINCGSDAHAHVAHCPLSKSNSVYGSLDQFHQCHRERRQRLVREKLSTLHPNKQASLKAKISKDLNDLGITV